MAAARRRITPIAVDQPVAPTLVLGAEVPLDVGPAPDQGDTKAIHATLGAGRRVWVDIQDTWQLKFKQVLRQQGLDYSTWKHEQDEQYAAHYRNLHGQDLGQNKRRPDLLTGMLRRVQGMLQPDDSDEGGSSGDEEDDSDEEGDGDDEEGGDGDGSSDDAEGEGGDEIDLDKEAEADGVRQGGPNKPKRARFERYEDDFIDDSEIEKVKGGPKVRTLYSGFYINKGNLEVIEEQPATKQRRKPAPKPPLDPAAAAAGGGLPAKRRKQQEPQHKQKEGSSQQPLQQQQQAEGQEAAPKKRQKGKQQADAAAADASEPSEAAGGSKKKRARSEAAAAAGTAAADGAAAAPASKKARKASPATSDAAAAPAQAGAGAGAGAGAAGTAKAALAAAMAAAAARKPAATGGVRGSSPSAALPPAGPSTAGSQQQQGLPAQQQQQQQQQQQPQQQAPRSRRITPAPVEATAASAAAMSAVFPGASQPEAAAGAAEGAAGGADAPAAAGLPADITQAAAVLQKAVQENAAAVSGPAATTATRNKVLGGPLSALGLAFARLPENAQAHHTAALLALAGPLLAHLSDKALRKKLLQEPRDKLSQAQESREKLREALGGVRGGAAAGGAGAAEGVTSDDDFQQAWTHVAEDSLVTAWNAAKAVDGQQGINQLALEVCEELGNTAVQGQPDKAVAELQQVLNRAKRRQKVAKEESKAIAAATAEAAAALAGADGAPAAAPQQQQQQQPAAAARTPSRQPSPAPGVMAAAAAAAAGGGGGGGTPAAKSLQGRNSLDSDTGTDEGGAEPDAARESGAGGPAEAVGTQGAAKVEWSQWSAPSPRLQRCVAAAKAAGASEEWLAEKYGSIRKGSSHGHQTFRILCCAGPAGCTPADFKAVSDAHDLGLDVDTSSKGKHGIKQALAGKGLSSIIGITEADPHKRALLAFPGVIQKAAKPAATPASTPGPTGQQGEGQAAAAAVQQQQQQQPGDA